MTPTGGPLQLPINCLSPDRLPEERSEPCQSPGRHREGACDAPLRPRRLAEIAPLHRALDVRPAAATSTISRASTWRSSACPSTPASPTASAAGSGRAAVREASMMLRPYNPNLGVAPFEVLSCIDYGDIAIVPGLHRAELRRDRGGGGGDRRGRRRAAAHRRRPRLHAGPPPGDALAMARSPSSTSTPIPTPGTATSARSTTTARGCAGRSRRAWSTSTTRSRSACAAPSTDQTTGPSCGPSSGLDYLTTEDILGSWARPPRPSGSGRASATGRPGSASTSTSWIPASRPGTGHARAGRTVGPRHAGDRARPDRDRLRRLRRRRGDPGLRSRPARRRSWRRTSPTRCSPRGAPAPVRRERQRT